MIVRRALLEAVMVGVLCGAVGVHVVLRRRAFFTMALGHATFPGLVLASIGGVSLLLGAGLFGVLIVLAVGLLPARDRVDDASAVGVVLAGSFALGVLVLSARSGFTRDLTAYLVGSVLTVGRAELVITAAVGLVVLAVLWALHKELVLAAFDRGSLAALGYPVVALDLALLFVIEATLVAAVPAAGTLLSVALIVIPAATARLWTDKMSTTMVVSSGLGGASAVVGVAASQAWRIAAGGAIVLTATAAFAVSLLLRRPT